MTLLEEFKLKARIKQLEAELATYREEPKPNGNAKISKLKIFMETFNELSKPYMVRESEFRHALMHTNHFTSEEVDEYIQKAIDSGMIYESARLYSRG
jgi:hypothetical protein